MIKRNAQDLEEITTLTLESYNQRAEGFWEGTRGHDVSQNIAALLQYIEGQPPFTILDFGCGPGRDLKRLKSWDTLSSAWKAPRVLLPWQRNRGTACGNRTS